MIINTKSKHLHVHVTKTGGTSFRRNMLKHKDWEGLGHHTPLDVCLNIRPELRDFYKTTMIRNPWEHAVSFYIYLLHKPHFNIHDFDKSIDKEGYVDVNPKDVTFEKYITSTYVKKHGQRHIIQEYEDENIVFDKWFNYAEYDKMLTYMEQRYSISLNKNLRIFDRKELDLVIDIDLNKAYQEYYNENTYNLVKQISSRVIEIFDYKF